MKFCTNCGNANPEGARFCAHCGVALAIQAETPPADRPSGESRKTVTVLFSDIAGSTNLGEQLDPEALRVLMNRYFAAARSIVERHGGTVEKFIGDAVMAVFGVPTVHEDDAVRAVRAAVEIREALDRMNDDFEARWGVRLGVRTGVNTGEVVAGDPEQGHGFVAGDAVNVAARLEQAAGAGEVLVGEATYRLTRDACEFAAEKPVQVKGKSAPLRTWRLVDVDPSAPGVARPADTPLVGRDRDLAALEAAFARARDERCCRLVTVVGAAGIGKSRLAEELLARVRDQATTATGRCLPYGTITYWPVREVVTELCGIEDGESPEVVQRQIAARAQGAGGEALAARIAEAVELVRPTMAPSADDTSWALRRLLEGAAQARPLVVIFDDIQWGEPTFLDLVEYLVGFMRDAPVLIVCLARPDLFESRPQWGGGADATDSISLGALHGSDVHDLLRTADGASLPDRVAERIAHAAEGNPLFLAEMQRMLIDDGVLEQRDGEWRATREIDRVPVPPTIKAVLSARLDRLGVEERGLLQRAAVIGRQFGWATVADMCAESDRAAVGARLQGLVRKGFLRPRPSPLAAGEMFEFAHILMRDVAYEGVPKASRADLHERLAAWLEERTGEDGAEATLLGYHLEQAHRLLIELGSPDDHTRRLGERGAAHLAGAGRRAYARGDLPAAIDLIDRALALTDEAPLRLRLLPILGDALCERGDLDRAERVLTESIELADERGDRSARHHGLVLRAYARSFKEGGHGVDELRRVAEEALVAFEELGDDAGLARAWQSIAIAHVSLCQWAEVELARRRELAHARRAGDQGMVLRALSALAYSLYFGPTTVPDAIAALEPMAAEVEGYPVAEATILSVLGALNAMLGRDDRADDLHRRGYALSEQLGALPAAEGALNWADTELLRGNPESAERLLRRAFETLDRARETAILASVAAALAESLHEQGRDDDAWLFCTVSQRAADTDDIEAQTAWRATRARILAARGDDAAAEDLARQAVTLAHGTDDLNLSARALLTLATVIGDHAPAEAEAAAAEALELYERKGNAAARARVTSARSA